MTTHKHIILAGRLYTPMQNRERGARLPPAPLYSQEQYAPKNLDAMREQEHFRSEVGMSQTMIAETVNVSDKQTPDTYSQQETQAKGESPISLASELDNGKYAKKSISRHNPADDLIPSCRMLMTELGRQFCINKCQYFENCLRGAGGERI